MKILKLINKNTNKLYKKINNKDKKKYNISDPNPCTSNITLILLFKNRKIKSKINSNKNQNRLKSIKKEYCNIPKKYIKIINKN